MTETNEDDRTLLARFAAQGDERSFETLVNRHGPLVYNVCLRVLGGSHDAEDAAQAVYLTLVHKAPSLLGRDSLAGWLHHVAWHVAKRARETVEVRKKHEQEAPAAVVDADEAKAQWSRLAPVLDDEIAALPEKLRLPIILHHLEGRSEEEGAKLLGWKLGTFSSRISRAREMLKRRLEQRTAMSLALLPILLTRHATAVPMPAGLAATTAKAAALTAAGNTAAGLVSSKAAALTKGTLTIMYYSKLKTIAALIVLTVALTGTGVVAYRALAAEKPSRTMDSPVTKDDNTRPQETATLEQIAASEKIVIEQCRKFVEAEETYHRTDHSGNGILKFAQVLAGGKGGKGGKLNESSDTRHGLWDNGDGLGSVGLIDKTFAAAECQRGDDPAHCTPEEGYLFRVLTRRGKSTPQGIECDFIVDGNMTRGYGLLAFPRTYGKPVKNCFITDNYGIIYKRDFGSEESMNGFVKDCVEFNDRDWEVADFMNPNFKVAYDATKKATDTGKRRIWKEDGLDKALFDPFKNDDRIYNVIYRRAFKDGHGRPCQEQLNRSDDRLIVQMCSTVSIDARGVHMTYDFVEQRSVPIVMATVSIGPEAGNPVNLGGTITVMTRADKDKQFEKILYDIEHPLQRAEPVPSGKPQISAPNGTDF